MPRLTSTLLLRPILLEVGVVLDYVWGCTVWSLCSHASISPRFSQCPFMPAPVLAYQLSLVLNFRSGVDTVRMLSAAHSCLPDSFCCEP